MGDIPMNFQNSNFIETKSAKSDLLKEEKKNKE